MRQGIHIVGIQNIAGMRIQSWVANCPSFFSIQGPHTISTTAATNSFGTKVSDIYWICVTTCTTLMSNPASMVNPSIG